MDEVWFYISLICGILFGLCTLNWMIVFYMLRDIDVIKQRYPKYMLIIGILSFFGYFDRINVILINNGYIKIYKYWVMISHLCFFITVGAAQYVMICRSFMVMLKVNFTKAFEEQKCTYFIPAILHVCI